MFFRLKSASRSSLSGLRLSLKWQLGQLRSGWSLLISLVSVNRTDGTFRFWFEAGFEGVVLGMGLVSKKLPFMFLLFIWLVLREYCLLVL